MPPGSTAPCGLLTRWKFSPFSNTCKYPCDFKWEAVVLDQEIISLINRVSTMGNEEIEEERTVWSESRACGWKFNEVQLWPSSPANLFTGGAEARSRIRETMPFPEITLQSQRNRFGTPPHFDNMQVADCSLTQIREQTTGWSFVDKAVYLLLTCLCMPTGLLAQFVGY